MAGGGGANETIRCVLQGRARLTSDRRFTHSVKAPPGVRLVQVAREVSSEDPIHAAQLVLAGVLG